MSEIKFNSLGGNYGFYQKDDSKPEIKEEAKNQAPSQESKGVAPDKVLDALSFMGAQNFAQVNKPSIPDVSKYLSDDRIASIEDSINNVFDKGVEKYAEAIKAEFGNAFSEETIYALAANAFAVNE